MVAVGEGNVGLTSTLVVSSKSFGDKAGLIRYKSVSSETAGASSHIPNGSKRLIYVRYRDHVIFKNVSQQPVEPVERETVGWLTNQTDELLLIQNDRAVMTKEKRVNGIIILRNCIIEACQLPFPSWN